ncbi:MAG: DUF1553 domain-containing protein [Planctomycetaceae bacterium]|jgi:hypothetical protein|nr:DUF1553 domain-containing protein [Planctomycetaceae bacterium]MBT5123537.1 DUF1553 domain-containing protein [Planctomycetaceae bacterium]MBT5599368.1 DUF1553 domain-containing protein [Planctomycetaceae bacterium]MBT5883261.1 DUF1553 domain-containing protein [Planctomycetaceae bacterium]
MTRRATISASLLLVLSVPLQAIDFNEEIAPLIVRRCLECHNSTDAQGGLDLTSLKSAIAGGDSKSSIQSPIENNFILQRIMDGEMPPEIKGIPQPLPAAELAILTKWISAGANWPQDRQLDLYDATTESHAGRDWWSLRPVTKPQIPSTGSASFKKDNAIDAFIAARLTANSLTAAPPADKRTLLRRLYYDVTGLPPKPSAITAYIANNDANAYETEVNKLLATHHFGQRWARYWLDLIRFADTCGYERDQLKPNIWKYRDWVIDALNADMPYDRFVRDQLAGDEVHYRDEQSVIATGMIRAGTWNDEPNDPADYVYTRLEDMVHTTTSAFLGLTVKCARCHNHKFDPIPQTDYYRTAALFWPGYMGQANLGGPSVEQLGYDAFGWTDRNNAPEDLRLLIKGERHRPADVIQPGPLSAISNLDKPFTAPEPGASTTYRRLQFANWITDTQNPLTARVMVNRIWQHYLGEGLVRTPNNFGFKGAPPTHPQLLDYLASELVSGQWKMKRIHKLILMSATYQQASTHPQQVNYNQTDFLNRYWWRANRKRLDAEALRDTLLNINGSLDTKLGGPAFYPKMAPDALEGLSRKASAWPTSPLQERVRRSIYMISKRAQLLPLMTTFDFAETTLPCARRESTIVAPQALALLNNHFVHSQSEALAERITDEHPADIPAQISRLWNLAYSRNPTKSELAAAKQHVLKQSLHFANQQNADEANHNPLPSEELLTKMSQANLGLWLRADKGVQLDKQGRVMFWRDQSPNATDHLHKHDASQATLANRPAFQSQGVHGKPAINFDGKDDFLNIAGQVIWKPHFSIFAVVSQSSTGAISREIISNWHRRGRSTNSVFLGTTGTHKVRVSDAFSPAGTLKEPNDPFILTAINGAIQTATYQNSTLLATQASLAPRVLSAPYVLGTQGNYGSEYWQGNIAELLIFDRPLNEEDRDSVWSYLLAKYQLLSGRPRKTSDQLALASLCHVVLNTNEFIFID